MERAALCFRKGAEFSLVPVAEVALGKQRILELYLNAIEWGPGVYGADAACRYYYRTPARKIDPEQAARLAAILPAPLKRKPERMDSYSALILERMHQMGCDRSQHVTNTADILSRIVFCPDGNAETGPEKSNS